MASCFTLDRLLILQAGHCFAKFSDGISIWVGDAGLDCVVTDQESCQLAYVPQYAPSSRSNIRQRLQMLFTIRNQFHSQPIAFANFVTPDAGQYCSLVRWPRSSVQSLCQYTSKNESIVYSCCRNYILRRIFGMVYLTFPIPISGGHGSIIIEQMWPIEDCPASWRHAANLAMLGDNTPECLDEIVIDMALPKSRSRLTRDLYQNSTAMTTLNTALPDHHAVIVEWMPDGVWHVADQGRAVTVSFASDHSILRSSDLKFFEHLSPWSPPALYSLEHAGEMDLASSPVPIISAMHRASRLLLHYHASTSTNAEQGRPLAPGPAISSIQRHTCSVPSLGEFTCFEDGRISARFFDRTIVHLNPAEQRLNVVSRDGNTVGINLPCVDLSDDLINYVHSTIAYFNWINMSPEERDENEIKARERNKLVLKQLQLSEAFLKNC